MSRALLLVACCVAVASAAVELPALTLPAKNITFAGTGAVKPALNWTLLAKPALNLTVAKPAALNLTAKELPSAYVSPKFNLSSPKNWTALKAGLVKNATAPKKLNTSISINPPPSVWNVSLPHKLTASGYASLGGGGGAGINNKTKTVNGVAVQTTGSPLNKTALLAAVGKPFNVSSISGDFSAGGGGGAGFTKNKTISTAGAKAVSIGGKQVLPPVPAKNISLNIDGGGGLGGGIKVTTATP